MNITIMEREPGVWRLRLEVGKHPDGRRRFKYETVRGVEDDARRRKWELQKAAEEGTLAEPSKMTLHKWFHHWIDAREAMQKVGRSTADNYRTVFDAYASPTLGALRLQTITGAQVQKLYGDLLRREGRKALSLSTVAHVHRVLRACFHAAYKQRVVAFDPMTTIEAPSTPKSRVRALTTDDAALIVSAIPEKDTMLRRAVALAFVTGLRRGELLGLRWKDVDLERGVISIAGQLVLYNNSEMAWVAPKTDSGTRRVSISADTVDELRLHRAEAMRARLATGLGGGLDDAYIFTDDAVNPIRPQTFSRRFKMACRAVGLEGVTLHQTRHTHITALLRAGKNLKAVSERAGHSDVTITMSVYAHVFEEDDRDLGDTAGALFGTRK